MSFQTPNANMLPREQPNWQTKIEKVAKPL
jgi:hypothetical protein